MLIYSNFAIRSVALNRRVTRMCVVARTHQNSSCTFNSKADQVLDRIEVLIEKSIRY